MLNLFTLFTAVSGSLGHLVGGSAPLIKTLPADATAEQWVEHLAQLKAQVEKKLSITVYTLKLPIDITILNDCYVGTAAPPDEPNLMYRTNQSTLRLEGHTTRELESIYIDILTGRCPLEIFPILTTAQINQMYQEHRNYQLAKLKHYSGLPL